uniref:Transmembrane BAX inhibitor motif containing 4 n=2 Tax=Mandrillus leucophaeus TaxID=9568 RepID=A0A2K5Y717_MANLE
MADPDSRYPCSSIEDDFNYGSSVASASVHIRMGPRMQQVFLSY